MSTRRSRRRRGRWSKTRRYLIEHRFNAAQMLLGLVAVTAGLWLLWPAPGVPVAHRVLWQKSFEDARETWPQGEPEPRGSLIAAAEASVAVSAKGHLDGSSLRGYASFERPRLTKVAATMPAIGVPDATPAPTVGRVVEPPALRAQGEPPAETKMAAVPLLAAPETRTPAVASGPRGAPYEWGTAPRSRPERRWTQPTWLENAVATPLADDRPAIAVVIDDLGLNRHNTALLNQLEAPLSLAFLPYAGALDEQTRAAHAAGHELLLHVPMEPVGQEWPGPNALVTSLGPDELVSRLRRDLRSFRGFVGINNHMGSRLTADRARMSLVMAELRQRDLLFLDSRTTAASVAANEAARQGVPAISRDVFLDNEIDLGYIRRQLETTERVARRNGVAVAMGHPHDATIEALRGWLPTLEARGFVLIPVSAAVARKACANGTLGNSSACGHYVSAQVSP